MARALVAAAVVLALAAPSAHAATAEVQRGQHAHHVSYVAAAGETNDVRVSPVDSRTLRIADGGATIVAGSGCTTVDAHTVECTSPDGDMAIARIDLGDGDDTVRASPNGSGIDVQGGPGDDVLVGGALLDWLMGGAGNDRLVGRGSDDYLYGGSGADRLYGQDGADSLYADTDDVSGTPSADPGDDVLSGGAGDDGLSGGSGADRLSGGGGLDSLRPEAGADTISCGPDYDSTYAPQVFDYLKADCEDVRFELEPQDAELDTIIRLGAYPAVVRRASVTFIVASPEVIAYGHERFPGRLSLSDSRGRPMGGATFTTAGVENDRTKAKVRLNRYGRRVLARPGGARVTVALSGERLPTKRWTVLLGTQP